MSYDQIKQFVSTGDDIEELRALRDAVEERIVRLEIEEDMEEELEEDEEDDEWDDEWDDEEDEDDYY